MTKVFSAPCVGGPQEGENLPYEFAADGGAFPMIYRVFNESAPLVCLGEYRFTFAGAERHGTGDTWRWHPFIGSIK